MIATINSIDVRLSELLKSARDLAQVIDRGPGGRNLALVITKLEDAQDRLHRAKLDVSIKEGEV